MIRKLLLPILVTALVKGQRLAETFIEDEPAMEPQVGSDAPGAYANETLIGRADFVPSRNGVFVERVSLLYNCFEYRAYEPYFYNGFVFNNRAWRTKGNERFTSVALVEESSMTASHAIISSSHGAYSLRKDYIFTSWDMLHFGKTPIDIRTTSPGKLVIQTWNAMPQLYIPLWMIDPKIGDAYMLHIYPEPFLLRYPQDRSYTDGLLWAKGDRNRLYKLIIDVEGLIKNLENFSVPNWERYISTYGVVETNTNGYQGQVAYANERKVDMRSSYLGASTEYVCNSPYRPMDVTWDQMQRILRRELTWL